MGQGEGEGSFVRAGLGVGCCFRTGLDCFLQGAVVLAHRRQQRHLQRRHAG